MHIFFHIPKAAGTTIREQIRVQIGAKKILSLTGYGGLSFLTDETINSMDLISGHVGINLLQRINKSYRGVSFLRSPVSRVYSQYRYMQSLVNRGTVFSSSFRRNIFTESLEYLLRDQEFPHLESLFRNTQTWFLATDWDAGNRNRSLCDADVIELAKKNIQESLDFFGLVEEMDLSCRLINKTFGWNLLNDMHLNVSERIDQELAPQLINLIEEHNQLDIELYSWAKKLFHDRCEKLLGGEKISITPNNFSGMGWRNGVRTDGASNMFYFIAPRISEPYFEFGDTIEFAKSGKAGVLSVEPSQQNGVMSVYVTVDRPIDPVGDGFPNKIYFTSKLIRPILR
jgi:hypothetical protein